MTKLTQEQRNFEDLIAAAETVMAVEILSTDYTATARDGPMVATARVLKALKGAHTTGEQFSFTETAWVGPSYRQGEYRILFLDKASSSESPKTTEWRGLTLSNPRRTDFFIEKDSVAALSSEALKSFLKKIQESGDQPQRVVFDERLTE